MYTIKQNGQEITKTEDTNYTASGLEALKTYSFNVSDGISQSSTDIFIPVPVNITVAEVKEGTLNIDWTPKSKCELFINDVSQGIIEGGKYDYGCKPSTTYQIKVCAAIDGVIKPDSPTSTKTFVSNEFIPKPVTNLKAYDITTNSFKLEWQREVKTGYYATVETIVTIGGFEVYRGDAVTCTVNDLDEGQSYAVEVKIYVPEFDVYSTHEFIKVDTLKSPSETS